MVTNPKRDIVDTFCHASGAFGHNPRLGLAIPYTWEVGSKDQWKWKSNGIDFVNGLAGERTIRMMFRLRSHPSQTFN